MRPRTKMHTLTHTIWLQALTVAPRAGDALLPTSATPLLDLIDYLMRSTAALTAGSHAKQSLKDLELVALRSRLVAQANWQLQQDRPVVEPLGYLYAATLFPLFDDSKVDEYIDVDGAASISSRSVTLLTAVRRLRAPLAFDIAVSAVSLLRYITNPLQSLPLSMLVRLLDTHDLPLALVPLIENPPWVRRKSTPAAPRSWQKFINHAWVDVPLADLRRLTTAEATVWLCLYNVCMEPAARSRYPLHTHRKRTLLRVRKFLNEVCNLFVIHGHVVHADLEILISYPPIAMLAAINRLGSLCTCLCRILSINFPSWWVYNDTSTS